MQTVKNVVIAAAGMGKRLGYGMPKALVDVDGRRIIDFQLELLQNVENVYMVVGFCDQEVMKYVKNIRADVIFVRNPNFKKTKTLESFYLASKLIKGKAVFMDGDMIIPREDFKYFLKKTAGVDKLIGVSNRISNDPVYASVNSNGEVIDFSYDNKSKYEWANLMCMDTSEIRGGKENVFEFLKKSLPISACCIDRLEIDTQEDLNEAKREIAEGYFDGK